MAIPVIEKMEIYPVAGHDCMELNLSGAHAPYFTRNIVLLTASNGLEGVGEVPGGEKITKALEDIRPLVEGTRIVDYKATMSRDFPYIKLNGGYSYSHDNFSDGFCAVSPFPHTANHWCPANIFERLTWQARRRISRRYHAN